MSRNKHSEDEDESGGAPEEDRSMEEDVFDSFFDEMMEASGILDPEDAREAPEGEQDDIALVMAALADIDARAAPARRSSPPGPSAGAAFLPEDEDDDEPESGGKGGAETIRVVQGVLPARDRDDPARRSLIDRLSRPKELRGPGSVDEVDAAVADLYESYPWADAALRFVMRDARLGQHEHGPFLSFRPLLLHGRPGCGKTSLGRDMAARFGVPVQVIEGATLTASFRITGAERSWKSAVPGDPVSIIADKGCANPLVLFDEVDKISPIGNGSDPLLAALGLLEPGSAASWKCAYSELDLDMSRVNWVLTANTIDHLPQPLIDRCHVIEVPQPRPEHLEPLLRKALGDVDRQDYLVREILARTGKGGGSLRRMMRMAERVRAALNAPVLH